MSQPVPHFLIESPKGMYPLRQPEGDYLGRIEHVKDIHEGTEKVGWLFFISTPNGDKEAIYGYSCKFIPSDLFKIRNLWVASGLQVSQDRSMVNPLKIVNRDVGITLVDHDYLRMDTSEIDDVFSPSDIRE